MRTRCLWMLMIVSGLFWQCGKSLDERARERYYQAVDLANQNRIGEAIEVFKEVRDRYGSTEWGAKAAKQLPFYEAANQMSQFSKALLVKEDFRAIGRACEMYKARRDKYPDTIQQLLPEYVKKVMKDPWGRPYLYVADSRHYTLACFGEDQIPGGDGDAKDVILESGKYTVGASLGDTQLGADAGDS